MAAVALTRLQLFSLPVTDPERAKRFYVETLGFELVNEAQMGPDMRWIQVRPPGAETSVTLVTWFDSMPAGSSKGPVIETDDLDGDIAVLAGRGVTFHGDVETAPWGRFVTFDDPDGNGLILQATSP